MAKRRDKKRTDMRLTDSKLRIKKLIDKYEADKSFYHSERYNETLLRSDFLDPLFEALGWDIKNDSGRSISEREVLLEEPLKSSVSEHTKKPDYTFRLFSERKFFLEAKKPSVNILENPGSAQQLRRYGFTAGLKISVLSNFEDLAIYDMTVPVSTDDMAGKARMIVYHYTEYDNRFEEIVRLLGRESVYNGSFDKEWSNLSVKTDKTAPIDKVFLTQINSWRLMLGEEIFKVMPDIDITSLNDTVQSYINKILFLRVCEDRNIEEYQSLLLPAEKRDLAVLIKRFFLADKKYNSGLFRSTAADRLLSPDCASFWSIIQQLYYPECPYSFSVMSSDILGRIYEIFLSQRLSFLGNELVIVNKPENVDKDIVTTPTFVVRELLRQTVKKHCQGKTVDEILQMKFADISCGSGAFLLELYGLLCDMAIDFFIKNDKSALIQTSVGTSRLKFEFKKKLLLSCVFGVDKDFNAAEATKFGLLLKLLENEDVNSLSNTHPILPNLDQNILWGNSLICGEDVKDENRDEINPFDFNGKRFDVIIGNPPYMKTEDMKNITPLEFPIYKSRYKTAYKQFDKYYLFIERGFGLLKDDGTLGYIVPSKFMKVEAGTNLRQLISTNKALSYLTSFGANLVFSDKSTYTCLLVLCKESQPYFSYTEIDNIDSWLVKDKQAFITDKKPESILSENVWTLYPNSLDKFYHSIVDKSVALSNIVGRHSIFNGIQTSAADIYVISPTKEDAKYVYFTQKGNEYKIERKYVRPFFKTIRGESLNTYHSVEPNSALIYPYERKKSGTIDLVPLTKMRSDAPGLYAYLMANKDVLSAASRNVRPKTDNENEWYRYGRHQSLGMGDIKNKIVVGVLSKGNKYGIDTNGVFLASGGTAGYCAIGIPEECEYSPFYIQAVLNSKYVEWIASLRGEIFRGGFIARGTKTLQDMPIRCIHFDYPDEKRLHDAIAGRQKKLIELGDRCFNAKDDKRKYTVAKRAFDHELKEQEDNLRTLYGLTDDEDRLVPLIDKMYETD